jgi:hypothetical protein
MQSVRNDDRRVAHLNLQRPPAFEEQPYGGAEGVEAHIEKLRLSQRINLGEGIRLRHSRVLSTAGVDQEFLDPHQNFQCHQGLDLGMV